MEVPLSDAEAATGGYYDRLSQWTGIAQRFGFGGGRSSLTVHRALADPRAGGQATVTRVHDLLLDALPATCFGQVLDAGCGLGGTMVDLARRTAATFTGLTLSSEQAAIGRRAIAKAALDKRIRIFQASYDEPPRGPFDLVIAIESLAHSSAPRSSLATLAACLAEGGWLAIVDDVPEPAARTATDLALFQQGWRLPVLLDHDQLVESLNACGLRLRIDHDLTGEIRPRSLARIALLEKANHLLGFVTPRTTRTLLDSYRGGLALERLYRRGLMGYRLYCAQKI